MTRHASAETLSRYRDGVVSNRKAAWIRAHLAKCIICSDLSAQLDIVPALLAQADMPPMPDHVAARIQSALAAESADRAARLPWHRPMPAHATAPDGAVHTPGRPDLPERSGLRRWRLRLPDLTSPRLVRVLAAAGAVMLLGGVGYALAGGGGTPPSRTSSGISAPRPTAQPSYKSNAMSGLQRESGGMRQVPYRQGGRSATFTAFITNENITPANLATKIRMQVARARKAAPLERVTALPAVPSTGASTTAKPGDRIGSMTVAQLVGCVTRVAAGRQVMFVEGARYEGRPAMFLVFWPLPPRTTSAVDVVVVAAACSASDGHVISQTTVPTG